MKWLNTLENLAAEQPLGKCPYCQNESLEFTFRKVNGEMGVGDIWCTSCLHAFHISRIQITPSMKTEGALPENLNYSS